MAELGKFEEKARKYVSDGTTEILIRNVALPKDDIAKQNTKKSMDEVKTLKNDKVVIENVYSNLRDAFSTTILARVSSRGSRPMSRCGPTSQPACSR
ncbi:hypothetical protein ACFLTP_09000 [Chloroflexota bacterium]